MGTSKRAEMKGSEAPGPGGYNPKFWPEGPQYTMAGKSASQRKEDAPGPGQYEQKKSSDGPQWAIGTSKRTDYKGHLHATAAPVAWRGRRALRIVRATRKRQPTQPHGSPQRQ